MPPILSVWLSSGCALPQIGFFNGKRRRGESEQKKREGGERGESEKRRQQTAPHHGRVHVPKESSALWLSAARRIGSLLFSSHDFPTYERYFCFPPVRKCNKMHAKAVLRQMTQFTCSEPNVTSQPRYRPLVQMASGLGVTFFYVAR